MDDRSEQTAPSAALRGWVRRARADCHMSLRELGVDMDSAAIVAHVVPYYHGWQVDGEWLDDWRDAVMAECDRLDGECREVRHG